MATLSPGVCDMLVDFCPLSPGAGFTHVREVCASLNRAWLRMKMKMCRRFLKSAINGLIDTPDNPRDADGALMLLCDLQDIL